MKERNVSNLSETLELLRNSGFSRDFVFENSRLKDCLTGISYGPKDMEIMSAYRFEGESDPDDMAIIYAVQVNSGSKGIIIDAFGTYADSELGDFIAEIPDNSDRKENNILNRLPSN